MKDHRLWMFGFLLVITSVLAGDAEEPGEVPYPSEATDQKQLERAADHNLPKVPPIPAVATNQKQLERAELTIAKYYDKVGKRLTATLADEEIPIRERVQAAKRLGVMKYPPAIGTLIRNNGLVSGTAVSEDWSVAFPCALALKEYGDAAVPQVVDAYIHAKENSSDRSRLIWVIGEKPTRRTALIYAKGLAAETIAKVPKQRLEKLIKGLSQ